MTSVQTDRENRPWHARTGPLDAGERYPLAGGDSSCHVASGPAGNREGASDRSPMFCGQTFPAVHVAIVGTRKEHVDEALAAAAIDLDDEVMHRIDLIMAKATPVSGPLPEMM